jgi:NADP-dependent 3-hydroxy acid dehydrogenase YdfG
MSLVKSWDPEKVRIIGTYRHVNSDLNDLKDSHEIELFSLDLTDSDSFLKELDYLSSIIPVWDNLIFATGTQEPVGDFSELEFDNWQKGFDINFTNQLKILHKLLPKRRLYSVESRFPTVLFFAGGGTNGSVQHYSAYTIAKIALIKMCEILNSEIDDTKFSIIGPGWVKTKIHLPTIKDGGEKSKENHLKTIEMMASDACTPMQDVVDSCNWILNTNSRLLSGRNFSSLNDCWDSPALLAALGQNPDMYKLRRSGNDWLRRINK